MLSKLMLNCISYILIPFLTTDTLFIKYVF